VAARMADAPDPAAAQALDFAYFAELVEAAGNVVFVLILNSIRQLYFENAELFGAIAADAAGLAPLYLRAAKAIDARSPGRAAGAIGRITATQEQRLLEALA
jgi:DNA-binding FadR family transcriptional regulator